MKRYLLAGLLAALLLIPAALHAQEDDGRVNLRYWMDGFGLYCTDADKTPADTYTDGGFRLLNPQGEEVLWVPAADIDAAIAEAEETGQYATVAIAPDDVWFFPNPAIYYHPQQQQFQLNIAKSSPDDLREGKLYEFRWTTDCHGLTTG